jgi:hypothetical protein
LAVKTGHLTTFSDIPDKCCESLSSVRFSTQMSGAVQHEFADAMQVIEIIGF